MPSRGGCGSPRARWPCSSRCYTGVIIVLFTNSVLNRLGLGLLYPAGVVNHAIAAHRRWSSICLVKNTGLCAQPALLVHPHLCDDHYVLVFATLVPMGSSLAIRIGQLWSAYSFLCLANLQPLRLDRDGNRQLGTSLP